MNAFFSTGNSESLSTDYISEKSKILKGMKHDLLSVWTKGKETDQENDNNIKKLGVF